MAGSRLVLMIRYLCDNGYVESAERLQTESQISLSNVDAADNVSVHEQFPPEFLFKQRKNLRNAWTHHARLR